MTDFDAFWDGVDREVARVRMAADLHVLPMRSTETSTTYAVRLTSVGPYRIFGYYSVPNVAGQVPGLLLTPRYGSVNHVPDYYDRARYAVFQVVHRGQRLADEPFAAAYPGLLTLDIEQPEAYVYRGIVADCLRGAEFLLSRAEVDHSKLAVEGDDLGVITAARRPVFTALLVAEPLLYRLLDAAARSDAYPVEELNDLLRGRPESREAVEHTLSFFDAARHADRVRAMTLLTCGDDPTWLDPLRAALGGRVEEYRLTHRGAEDHDWRDAWLARQLGAEPRSRFAPQGILNPSPLPNHASGADHEGYPL